MTHTQNQRGRESGEISEMHNEEGEFGEFDTQRTYRTQNEQWEESGHLPDELLVTEEVAKRQRLLGDTRYRRL